MTRHAARLTWTFLSLCLVPSASAGDIWVDAVNGSDGQSGASIGLAKKTITGAMAAANSGDVLRVVTGTYDVALGESFPVPIKHNVDIIGAEVNPEDWPRIGGDVNTADSSVEALFEVQATAGSKTGIDIRNLFFIGENSEDRDAPSSLIVRVSSGYTAEVKFEENVCTRPFMSDAENDDRSTILIEGGWGLTDVTILNCPGIEPSRRGAIEVRNGTDTTESHQAIVEIKARGNRISIADLHDIGDFGFAFLGSGEEWVEPRISLQGNVIDTAISVAHDGIRDGVYIELLAEGDGDIRLQDESFHVVNNTVLGCRNAAFVFRDIPLSDTATHGITLTDFERNTVSGMTAQGFTTYGLLIEQSSSLNAEYGGDITINSRSNMFVQCDTGARLVNANGGTGEKHFTNDTIADNYSYGIVLAGDDAWIDSLVNCIVYFNNANGDQCDPGSSGWSPGAVTFEHCDFFDFSGGQNNIDGDPLFVNAGAGNYHLASNSPCINVGDNTPDSGISVTEFDIDRDDRIDLSEPPRIIDMGADEYMP